MIVFLMLGFAAGIYNVMRRVGLSHARARHVRTATGRPLIAGKPQGSPNDL
jgi:F0F1-type ATP synthase assembly protein I